METSVFSRIMNNQTRRFPSSFVFALILCVALDAVPIRGQTQTQFGADRVSVNLSDPSRPAFVKASLVSGGITVKAYDGKEIVVEARARNRESARADSTMKRIPVSSTGLSVEEENNEVSISTDSYMRPIDLTISVPVHTSRRCNRLRRELARGGRVCVLRLEGCVHAEVTGQSCPFVAMTVWTFYPLGL